MLQLALVLVLAVWVRGAPPVVDYSGAQYYPVGPDQIFSWWFRSSSASPKGLVVYSNGGPFCSSLMALLYEQGPFTIDSVTGLPVPSPHSWGADFHLLYIDHPVGTGLSYGPTVVTDEQQDATMYVDVLQQFFANPANAGLAALPLWFAGES